MNLYYILETKIIHKVDPVLGHITLNSVIKRTIYVKLRCDERFTHAFTACNCVLKGVTLIGSNQGNFFKNAITNQGYNEHFYGLQEFVITEFDCNFK